MPVLLGVLSSLLIGISDTLGRGATKRSTSVAAVGVAMLTGSMTGVVLAILVPSELIARDVLFGAISGVLIGSALAIMYRGMVRSSAAVVSPLAAVLTALLPLAWDVARGSRPGPIVAAGCAVAILSLLLTTTNPDLGDRVLTGVAHGLVSGATFACALVFLGETSEESGAWPVVAQRFVGFVLMFSLAAMRWNEHRPARGRPTALAVMSGMVGTCGIAAFIVGAQRGDLGVVSVAASMYPAVVAVLAAKFDDDELRWWQMTGIVGAIVGLTLITLG